MVRHHKTVWRTCWRFAKGDEEQCKDLMQEVFIMLWLRFDELRTDVNEWQQRAWVKKISQSVLIDLYRHRETKTERLCETMANSLPDTPTDYTEHLDDLMAHLSSDDRRLMQMRLDGYDASEIASELGIMRNTVYQRMHRAMEKARKIIIIALMTLVTSSLAVVVVPQLRKWIFHRTANENTPMEQHDKKPEKAVPVTDTLPTVTKDTVKWSPIAVPPLPSPHYYELADTSQPIVSSNQGTPCGCSDKQRSLFSWEECDTTETEADTLSEVSIIVNGNIILVEGADNEMVSVFDGQRRLVARTQCIGFCSLTVTPNTLNSRNHNSEPYWVQVGSRPMQQVFLRFPNSGFISYP